GSDLAVLVALDVPRFDAESDDRAVVDPDGSLRCLRLVLAGRDFHAVRVAPDNRSRHGSPFERFRGGLLQLDDAMDGDDITSPQPAEGRRERVAEVDAAMVLLQRRAMPG